MPNFKISRVRRSANQGNWWGEFERGGEELLDFWRLCTQAPAGRDMPNMIDQTPMQSSLTELEQHVW